MSDRLRVAREVYEAYVSGERDAVDARLTDDFVFFSPPDPGIDRADYFERCSPNSELIAAFDFVRLIESATRSSSPTRARRPMGSASATPRS